MANISTARGLWERLKSLYMTKSHSNRLYLKEQFYTIRMKEGTNIADHLSVLNRIVSKLEAIGVKINDKDMGRKP